VSSQLHGADLEALDALRLSFENTATGVLRVTAQATAGASDLAAVWNGPDANDFNHQWNTVHRPTMLATVDELRAAAATIERNVSEQRTTSQADLAGGLGGPGGAGGSGGAGPGPGGPGGPGGPSGPGPGPLAETSDTGPRTDSESDGTDNPSAAGGGDRWLDEALDSADIDLEQWRPELGADANRDSIIDVYRYYGDLFLADPDLQWAGMANAIGPSFAAGFFDLANFRELAGNLEDIASRLPPGAIPLPSEAIEALAGVTEEELRFYETTFLQMQYDIFLDQAPMHEAYRTGGIDAVRLMGDDNMIPPDMVDAWELLDEGKRGGDRSLITEANTLFLRREQEVIIDGYYQEMYRHFPSGPAFTYLMTMVGTPSIPGADGYAEAYPIDVSIETPGPERLGTPDHIGPWSIPNISVDNPLQGTVTIETPFPNGNLASLEDRWRLIEENTLPAYLDLDPDAARDLAAADVGERIDEQRLGVDDVIDVVTDWEVQLDQ